MLLPGHKAEDGWWKTKIKDFTSRNLSFSGEAPTSKAMEGVIIIYLKHSELRFMRQVKHLFWQNLHRCGGVCWNIVVEFFLMKSREAFFANFNWKFLLIFVRLQLELRWESNCNFLLDRIRTWEPLVWKVFPDSSQLKISPQDNEHSRKPFHFIEDSKFSLFIPDPKFSHSATR